MRIFKRPMFKKGGSTSQGIMTGLTDRKKYATGPSVQEIMAANESAYANIPMPRDRSLDNLTAGIGFGIFDGKNAGEGDLKNIVRSAQKPYENYLKSKQAQDNLDFKLKLARTDQAVKQKTARDLKEFEIDAAQKRVETMYGKKNTVDIDTLIRKDALANLDNFSSFRVSENDSKFKFRIEAEMKNKYKEEFGDKIGAGQDADKYAKKIGNKKGNIGKFFYDVNDGQTKRLRKNSGEGPKYIWEIIVDTEEGKVGEKEIKKFYDVTGDVDDDYTTGEEFNISKEIEKPFPLMSPEERRQRQAEIIRKRMERIDKRDSSFNEKANLINTSDNLYSTLLDDVQ